MRVDALQIFHDGSRRKVVLASDSCEIPGLVEVPRQSPVVFAIGPVVLIRREVLQRYL